MHLPQSIISSRTRSAFTLVELLVVIAIIVLLLALLMPVFSGAMERVNQIVCMSNMRQLASAWVLYAGDHGGRLVGAGGGNTYGWVDMSVPGSPASITGGLLYPYTRTQSVYHCPVDSSGHQWSYSMNMYLNGEAVGGWCGGAVTQLANVKNPGQTMLLTDENDPRGWNGGAWVNYGQNMWPCAGVGTDDWVDYFGLFHQIGSLVGVNFVFADGHAEFWPLTASTVSITWFYAHTPGNTDLARLHPVMKTW